MTKAPWLLLLMAAPAAAHDGGADRALYEADLCRARAQARLDCAQLVAAVESERLMTNRAILMEYQRPLSARFAPPRAPYRRVPAAPGHRYR